MNKVAGQYDAINLAQGFPNFPCSDRLVELVHYYMRQGFNQYPPMPGVLGLREAIARKVQHLHGATYDHELEVTVTPGGHVALTAALSSFLRTGDEVIIFEPAFDCFAPIVELNGAIPRFIEIIPPDCRIDWDLVRSIINPRTRAIILNTPHNPTGAVLKKSDLEVLADIVRNTQIILVSDEVYEHIVFDSHVHESICRHDELRARSFVVFSFGKVFHTTGWKIGYCLAPRSMMDEFRRVYQMICFCSNAPMQHAIAEYLQDKESYLSLPGFYQAKRDYFLDRIRSSRFAFRAAQGSYFQLLSFRNISSEPDTIFAEKLAREHRVAAIPVSVFCRNGSDHGFVRVCFAKTEETLAVAAERLCQV